MQLRKEGRSQQEVYSARHASARKGSVLHVQSIVDRPRRMIVVLWNSDLPSNLIVTGLSSRRQSVLSGLFHCTTLINDLKTSALVRDHIRKSALGNRLLTVALRCRVREYHWRNWPPLRSQSRTVSLLTFGLVSARASASETFSLQTPDAGCRTQRSTAAHAPG
jgi:hypothetical protein